MSKPNYLHAVLFDLDGTLRHNRPGGFETFVEYAEELGATFTLEQLQHGERWTHYYWAASPELKADLEEFGGESTAFWFRQSERQLQALEVSGDVVAELALTINRFFNERYAPDDHIPNDVLPTLRQLRSDGYILGLVSNRTEPLDSVVAELGLEGAFHFTLSAGQAQSWKPAPGIFLKAVELAGCRSENAVYVGDNFYADIEGSREAGLHSVLIDSKGIFHQSGCPVIRALGELAGALEQLGTKSAAEASVA